MTEEKSWLKRILNSKQSMVLMTLMIFVFTVFVFAFQNCEVPDVRPPDSTNLPSGRTPGPSTSPTPDTPINCSAEEYDTRGECDRDKPENASCSEQGNGCYAWSCDEDYNRENNECVGLAPPAQCEANEHNSELACNNDSTKPANSTCKKQASECYAWECDTDYMSQGSQCIACQSQTSCDASNPTNSTCTGDSNGCHTWSCDSTYTLVSGQCQATSAGCNDGEYANQALCNQNKPATNATCSQVQGSSCHAWSCDTGFSQNGQECVAVVNGACSSPPYQPNRLCEAGTLSVASSPLPAQWDCNGSGTGSTNAQNCNTCPTGTYAFLDTCEANNPANANTDCYQIPTGETNAGCYGQRCKNGYNLNQQTNQCEQIQSGTLVDGQCPSAPYDLTSLCVQGDPSVASSPPPTQWDCNGRNNGQNAEDCNTCPNTNTNPLLPFNFYPFRDLCRAENPQGSVCQNGPVKVNDVILPGSQGCWAWLCDQTAGYKRTTNGSSCECDNTRDYQPNSDNSGCVIPAENGACHATNANECTSSASATNTGGTGVADGVTWTCPGSHNGQDANCLLCNQGFTKNGNACVSSTAPTTTTSTTTTLTSSTTTTTNNTGPLCATPGTSNNEGANCAGNGRSGAAGCCERGTFNNNPPDDQPGQPTSATSKWKWQCRMSGHTPDNCEAVKPETKCGTSSANCAGNGQNNAEGCCAKGVFHGHPADTNGVRWTCRINIPENTDNNSSNDDNSNNIRCPASSSTTTTTTTTTTSSSVCTCGTTGAYTCGNGCTRVLESIGQNNSTTHSYLGKQNRYAEITNRSYTWDCDAASKTIKTGCTYKTTECIGGRYRRSNGTYDPDDGLDGCNSGNNNAISAHGTRCTATSNNTSCTYVGYCDKATFGGCGGRCTTKTCTLTP